MHKYGLKFPPETAQTLGLTIENGVAKVTPFELTAALTRHFEKPFSPEGFHEDLRLFYLARHAAEGIIAGGNWRLKAFHSGLNGFVDNHLQIDKQQAADWLSCLMFLYFSRYGKTEESHNGGMAHGFGAFLSLADVARIAELPDLLYPQGEEGPRPPLLTHCILMYLELTEEPVGAPNVVSPVEPGEIELYFE